MAPVRIAFYGKGGIGKSTIASNISAVFAKRGKKVLHIGCDPKADSTRTLLKRRIRPVLEVLGEIQQPKREDLLHQGVFGVTCAEAGGPEAGSGCAGLGIMTAAQELERLGIMEENWDVIVYDVLGDVVCGGFSAPMRKHYADSVYVVTSSDYMALYAANNILKGICRYSGREKNLFGGVILNHVKGEGDIRIAQEFAEKTGAAVIGALTQSSRIPALEYQRELLVEAYPEEENAVRLERLADRILSEGEFKGGISPMNHEELEEFGRRIYEREWKE